MGTFEALLSRMGLGRWRDAPADADATAEAGATAPLAAPPATPPGAAPLAGGDPVDRPDPAAAPEAAPHGGDAGGDPGGDAAAGDVVHGLILLEIDDFPSYELLFGDTIARSILHAVEERVMPALPATAGFWSPGRGKIAVSLPGADLGGIRLVARHLQRLVARDGLETGAGRVYVTVSAGCALADTEALPLLGPTAERALGDARRSGRGRCRIMPTAATGEGGPDLGELALRDIEAGRIAFAFQTVRRIDGGGRAAFLEMLVRLPNEGAEPIAAARFMPAVIEAGQAAVLDRAVLTRAFDLMVANPGVRMSVNVSRQTMEDPGWLGLLTARTAVDVTLGDRLIVELSERDVTAEPALAGAFMAGVRRSGAALALDRFGEMPLTAADLQRFRCDIVKLSPGLCHRIADEPARQARLREQVTLARAADLMIVATGVERQTDADWLAGAGVGYGQGLLWGAPDAAPDLAAPHGARRVAAALSPFRGSASRAASASP